MVRLGLSGPSGRLDWQHQPLFGHLTGQFRFMKKPFALRHLVG